MKIIYIRILSRIITVENEQTEVIPTVFKFLEYENFIFAEELLKELKMKF